MPGREGLLGRIVVLWWNRAVFLDDLGIAIK